MFNIISYVGEERTTRPPIVQPALLDDRLLLLSCHVHRLPRRLTHPGRELFVIPFICQYVMKNIKVSNMKKYSWEICYPSGNLPLTDGRGAHLPSAEREQ